MKLVVCRIDTRKKNKSVKRRINIERILFTVFTATFAILIVVQTILASPSANVFTSYNASEEGVPLGIEEYLYEEGQVRLELINGEPDGTLKLLQNGDTAAVFNSTVIDLTVKDGDILEVCGSSSNEGAEVTVTAISSNIIPECVNRKVKVKPGIEKLTEIKID